VAKKLPARPNLDHLRHQAKALLSRLNAGDSAAAQAFIEHLPRAAAMKAAAVRAAGFRLADAQSVVARQSGFAGWPALSRHVGDLRALEGEWRFDSLEVEGAPMPTAMLKDSRILIDGDRTAPNRRKRTTTACSPSTSSRSPRGSTSSSSKAQPATRATDSTELDGDRLTVCSGLRAEAPRPASCKTGRASGLSLERLRRGSAARPDNVTGGTPRPAPTREPAADREDPSAFEVEMTPLLRRLEGEWAPVELVMDGKPMPAEWLAFGSRAVRATESKSSSAARR
jgi:uncharacterized protein (TIGR03067 family)